MSGTRRTMSRAVTCLALGREVKGGVVDLGDLSLADPLLSVLVPDRVRVLDRRPPLRRDRLDRLPDRWRQGGR